MERELFLFSLATNHQDDGSAQHEQEAGHTEDGGKRSGMSFRASGAGAKRQGGISPVDTLLGPEGDPSFTTPLSLRDARDDSRAGDIKSPHRRGGRCGEGVWLIQPWRLTLE